MQHFGWPPMPEEVTVIVAEATANESIQFHHDAPQSMSIRAGDTLRVRMPYRLHDQPKPEELWTFRLAARIDDGDEAVSERIHRDRKMMSDDVLSNVGVDLHFPNAGEYTVHYDLFARLSHREWDEGASFAPVAEQTVNGAIQVVVE